MKEQCEYRETRLVHTLGYCSLFHNDEHHLFLLKSFLKMLTFRHSASSEQWGRTGSGDTEKAEKEKNLARFQGVQKRKKTARWKTEG